MATKQRTLPDLLEEARGNRSYKQAADALGITDRMYKQWETGYAQPDPNRSARIAEFCGVSQADVLVLMGILTPEQGKRLRELDDSGDTLGGAIPGLLDELTLTPAPAPPAPLALKAS